MLVLILLNIIVVLVVCFCEVVSIIFRDNIIWDSLLLDVFLVSGSIVIFWCVMKLNLIVLMLLVLVWVNLFDVRVKVMGLLWLVSFVVILMVNLVLVIVRVDSFVLIFLVSCLVVFCWIVLRLIVVWFNLWVSLLVWCFSVVSFFLEMLS